MGPLRLLEVNVEAGGVVVDVILENGLALVTRAVGTELLGIRADAATLVLIVDPHVIADLAPREGAMGGLGVAQGDY